MALGKNRFGRPANSPPRLASWPWLAAGTVLFGWRKPVFALVCTISAFIWLYADEARPYAMQIGLGLALLRSTLSLVAEKLEPREEIFWQIILILSGTLLAMSHLLGMFWTAAYWGFYFSTLFRRQRISALAKTWLLWSSAIALLGLTSYWYLWTITHGQRAGAGVTDLRNLIFSSTKSPGSRASVPAVWRSAMAALPPLNPSPPSLPSVWLPPSAFSFSASANYSGTWVSSAAPSCSPP